MLEACLQNTHDLGKYECVSNVVEAFRMLRSCIPPKSHAPKPRLARRPVLCIDDKEQELGFFQEDEDGDQHSSTIGIDEKACPSIKSDHCKELGHCKAQCHQLKGKIKKKEANLLHLGDEVCDIESKKYHEAVLFGVRCNFLSKSKSLIPDCLLLTGTGSTCAMIGESNLLSDVRKLLRP